MERIAWQVKHIFPLEQELLDDLEDWQPFASTEQGGILVRRQVLIESGEKSSVGHELTFEERYER